MSAQIKELLEKRAEKVAAMRKIMDAAAAAKRNITAEETQQFALLDADVQSLTEQRDRLEKLAKLEAETSAIPGREDRNDRHRDGDNVAQRRMDGQLAFRAWYLTQQGEPITEAMEEACKRTGFNPTRKALDFNFSNGSDYARLQQTVRSAPIGMRSEALEQRGSLSAVTSGLGGATVPAENFIPKLERAMLLFGGPEQVAEIMTTTSGETLTMPTSNDTTNKGRIIAENNGGSTSQTTESFGQIQWFAYKYTSDAILVPSELLDDSAVDLAGMLGDMLGERLGRIGADHFTTGTGAGQPKGLITAATLGKTTASATAITADEIIDLVHSVNPAYRNGASFMLHDSILQQIRKIKDSYGQYLWQPSIQLGIPDKLYGYNLTINQSMDSAVTTTKKTVAFGLMNKYKIRRVKGVRLFRLQERYRDADQDGFVAFVRQDGNLLDAGVAPVKYLQQA
jgi:HK97 family phage major capsid protein